jgi:hypothetical protein
VQAAERLVSFVEGADVVAASTANDVAGLAVCCVDAVGLPTAEEPVVSAITVQDVGTSTAAQPVVRRTTSQDIARAASAKHIATAAAE